MTENKAFIWPIQSASIAYHKEGVLNLRGALESYYYNRSGSK